MSDMSEIPRALKRLVEKMFRMPSGNVVRVTRVFHDKETGEVSIGAVYDGVFGTEFKPEDTKNVVMTPAFLQKYGVPY